MDYFTDSLISKKPDQNPTKEGKVSSVEFSKDYEKLFDNPAFTGESNTVNNSGTLWDVKKQGFDKGNLVDMVKFGMSEEDAKIAQSLSFRDLFKESFDKNYKRSLQYIQDDLDRLSGEVESGQESPLSAATKELVPLIGAGATTVAGTGFDVALGTIGKFIPDEVKQDAKKTLENIADTEIGKTILSALKGGVEGYAKIKESNPDLFNQFEGILEIGEVIPVGAAIKNLARKASSVATKIPNNLARKASSVATSGEVLENVGSSALRKQAFDIEQAALDKTAELLQGGSKGAALSKGGKYSRADVSLNRLINSTDVEIKNVDQLVKLTESSKKKARNAVMQKIKPFAEFDDGDQYLKKLSDEVERLSLDPQYQDVLPVYQDILKRESEYVKSIGGSIKIGKLQERKESLGDLVGSLYQTGGGRVDLNPTERAKLQALDLLRDGAKDRIESVAGADIARINEYLSGLIDAESLLKIQRDRVKNALSGVKYEYMTPKEKVKFVSEKLPEFAGILKGKLTFLDTKSGLIDAIIESTVRQIRGEGLKSKIIRESAKKTMNQ